MASLRSFVYKNKSWSLFNIWSPHENLNFTALFEGDIKLKIFLQIFILFQAMYKLQVDI